MHTLTRSFFPSVCFRYFWIAFVCLAGLLTSLTAAAQAVLPAYYSTGSNTYSITQPSPQVSGSGTVTGGANAADGDFSTYATLSTDATATVGKPVGLRLNLTGVAPAGYRAGFVLANATNLLSLNAIGTVRLRTYLTGADPQLREEKVVRADLVRAALLATDKPTQLEFSTSQSFDAVEIVIDGLVGVNYTTNIFYAYGVQPGVQTRASGYLSRFASPTGTEYKTSTSSGALCVNSDVLNPERVADFDLTNFALLHSTLTVLCDPGLSTKLANVPSTGVPEGNYAGFVIGQNSLLDVGVLSGLKLSTYFKGALVESHSGIGALNLTLLPNNKAQVSFVAGPGKNFDEVKIERIGVLTALDDLQVYYGFGLAPGAFQGINPVLSDFGAPVNNVDYFASAPQSVAVTTTVMVGGILTTTTTANVALSNVDNPQNAADANTTNYAQLNTTGVGLATGMASASLKLKLNGSGKAGNRVGMVVESGAGLLDLAALQNMTLSTYDANNVLIETKTGSQLLSVLLGDGTPRSKMSFLASRDFSYAQLTVNTAASVSSNTRVYYAFAEDVPLLSLQYPLPVELSAFSGRWINGAAELNWATASEKNSRHFVVERATRPDATFEAVGQVAAAGNSSAPKTYKLRDAEAGRLGVATVYYRLRQVDLDGSQSFSPVVAVAVSRLGAAAQLDVYPNPAPDAHAVTVRCSNLTAGGTVQTYSQLGQLVSELTVTENAGPLALPALAPGLYHVVLRDASGQRLATQRLVIGNR